MPSAISSRENFLHYIGAKRLLEMSSAERQKQETLNICFLTKIVISIPMVEIPIGSQGR